METRLTDEERLEFRQFMTGQREDLTVESKLLAAIQLYIATHPKEMGESGHTDDGFCAMPAATRTLLGDSYADLWGWLVEETADTFRRQIREDNRLSSADTLRVLRDPYSAKPYVLFYIEAKQSQPPAPTHFLDIVFDGDPTPPEGKAQFVEVEDETGKSVRAGTWLKRDDGYWTLRIPREATQ